MSRGGYPTFRRADPPYYDKGQVCVRGHLINADVERYPERNKKFCPECGGEVIDRCPDCKTQIQGQYHSSTAAFQRLLRPTAFCHDCGKPYPWQQEAIDAAKALAAELELDEAEQVDLKAVIDGLTVESSMTSVAAVRFKKLLLKANGPAIQLFKDSVSKIAAESAKKWLGL